MTPAIDFVGGLIVGVVLGVGCVFLLVGIWLAFAKSMGARSRMNREHTLEEIAGNLGRQISNCDDAVDRYELNAAWQFCNNELKNLRR